MRKVYTLKDAREFFLNNATGSILCVDGDASIVAECYPDAERFYLPQGEK